MDNTNDNNTINPSEKTQLDPCACRRKGAKLEVYDWLSDVPESHDDTDLVEVRFKNTRKGYYRNTTHIKLAPGDLVAVEASPGHDIGEVTLTGRLVLIQMKKNNVKIDNPELKRVYRKAKPNDLEKFEEAKAKEHDTMIRARKIAEDLHLNMKIGDVEYQGDGNKAIFYYIADERVDFRQLIKVLAEAFRVRIEMKQIGARQEAGRIGGFGTIDFNPNEVAHFFPEIFEISQNCRFNNCTHRHEPGCAVLKALENHQISESRYTSYLSIIEDSSEGKYREAF